MEEASAEDDDIYLCSGPIQKGHCVGFYRNQIVFNLDVGRPLVLLSLIPLGTNDTLTAVEPAQGHHILCRIRRSYHQHSLAFELTSVAEVMRV